MRGKDRYLLDDGHGWHRTRENGCQQPWPKQGKEEEEEAAEGVEVRAKAAWGQAFASWTPVP